MRKKNTNFAGRHRVSPQPNTSMLCFDIKTTGLDRYKDRVTCVCVYDPSRGISQSFIFDHPPKSQDSLRKQGEVTLLLDEADQLCAFNGARFDLPFLAKQWGIVKEHLAEWVVKLVDIFEASKLALGMTFSLNLLLATNGLTSKTGSGLEAIRLAEEGKWAALADYCMQDVLLTYEVTSLPTVNLPKTSLKWSISSGFFK